MKYLLIVFTILFAFWWLDVKSGIGDPWFGIIVVLSIFAYYQYRKANAKE